jgi:hypothetical protein
MLTECTHNESAFFSTPGILEELIDNPLLHFDTSVALAVSYLDERPIHSLYSQWLRLS